MRALELDFLARRYGVLPSKLLKSTLVDYQFDLFIAHVAVQDEQQKAAKGASYHGKKQ